MRYEDVVEMKALGNECMEEVIQESVDLSEFSSVAIINGDPVCIYGLRLVDLMSSTGVPWMLGTHNIIKHRKSLAIESVQVLEEMKSITPNMINVVHYKNEMNINWLKKLGFTIGSKIEFKNDYFHYFYLGNPNV